MLEKRTAENNYEIRVTPAEIRELEDDKKIVGKIPYQTWSQDLGGFKERILPSAFNHTLNNGDEIWSLFQHDYDKVMGRRSTGTLLLNNTPDGLEVEISPSDTTWSRDALEAIRHGDVDGFSFGFWVREDCWGKDENGVTRDLISVELGEVSVVFNPAYRNNAQISVRALNKVRSFKPSIHILECEQKLAELSLQNL